MFFVHLYRKLIRHSAKVLTSAFDEKLADWKKSVNKNLSNPKSYIIDFRKMTWLKDKKYALKTLALGYREHSSKQVRSFVH